MRLHAKSKGLYGGITPTPVSEVAIFHPNQYQITCSPEGVHGLEWQLKGIHRSPRDLRTYLFLGFRV